MRILTMLFERHLRRMQLGPAKKVAVPSVWDPRVKYGPPLATKAPPGAELELIAATLQEAGKAVTQLTQELKAVRSENQEKSQLIQRQEEDLNTLIAACRLIETPGPGQSSPRDIAAVALDKLRSWRRPGWVDRMKDAAEQA
jgi:hypothetical protein